MLVYHNFMLKIKLIWMIYVSFSLFSAPPAIDDHSKSKNMVQGEDLELHCEVSGYPAPTITWFKDDMPFNTSTRIHLMEYKGMPAGQLTIYSLDFDDKGKYSCLATSSDPDFANNTATADINIRVKGKITSISFSKKACHLSALN